ncbi:MAG: hypothetical protein R3B45_15680 [Bdellovibrionota bacterium]
MTDELSYLNFLLAVALVLGPMMTRKFFLCNSRIYGFAHLIAFLVIAVGFTFSVHELYLIWAFFCLFGFLIFLRNNFSDLFNLKKLAECIPFVFSIIASIWLFSGANDLFLLGYNREWSYYAALHGNYLGWMLVGLFTIISRAFWGRINTLYLTCAFVFLLLFLLIAFGIDGVPYIKQIGTMGVVCMAPLLIGYYTFSLWQSRRAPFYFSAISFISILFTLYLAASNELRFLPPFVFLDVPSMVSLHGLINGLVAIPSLYLASYFDGRINEHT